MPAASKKKTLKKQISEVGTSAGDKESRTALLRLGAKPPKPPSAKSKQASLEKTIVEHLNEYGESDSDEDDSTSTSTQSLLVSQQSRKVPKQLEESELRAFVHQFIGASEEIYLDVLNYIPLDIEALSARVKEALKPRRCNAKLLMKVLDEFCVTFTMKNLSTRTHQGKPKYQRKT
jgi:hypothetical protein